MKRGMEPKKNHKKWNKQYCNQTYNKPSKKKIIFITI